MRVTFLIIGPFQELQQIAFAYHFKHEKSEAF